MKNAPPNFETPQVQVLSAARVPSYAERMTRTVNISEAKATLSKIANDVAAGEEVIVVRSGQAVMKLVSPTADEIASTRANKVPRDLWVTAKYFENFDWDAWDKLDDQVHKIWRRFGHMD